MSCAHIINQAALRIECGLSTCNRFSGGGRWYVYTSIRNALISACQHWHGPELGNGRKSGFCFLEPSTKLLEGAFGCTLEEAGKRPVKEVVDTLREAAKARGADSPVAPANRSKLARAEESRARKQYYADQAKEAQ